MSTPVKHPQPLQLPQHPQPPRSAANHNSARPDLPGQAELGRLYKPACPSISKIIKYVYTNPAFKAEEVKKNLMAGRYDLTQVRRLNIALENFHQINNGGICKLDAVGKLERKWKGMKIFIKDFLLWRIIWLLYVSKTIYKINTYLK